MPRGFGVGWESVISQRSPTVLVRRRIRPMSTPPRAYPPGANRRARQEKRRMHLS
ncbi:hypothetical protein PISMIDRAFT_686359, partial [Pisolithus microcarpus 441]